MTEPLTITNFGGGLTRRNVGDINSGLTKFETSWGYDPFSKPGNLTWMEQPTSILSTTAGATNNLIVAMKQRSTGSVLAAYIIDGAARLQRVRVNNAGTYIADVDSPSIVGTLPLTLNFERSTGMVFYGTTEKIFYGDGLGHLQKIDFEGSNPTSIFGTSSVTALVPRPMAVFQGKVYFGNGNNIGEIDSTELITTGAKLSPALPTGVVVRDLDVSPDGNYLQLTTSNNTAFEDFVNIDTTLESAVDSNKYLWNGVDAAATASEKYGGTFLTANNAFSDKDYTFGYDQRGGTVFLGQEKKVSLPNSLSPHHSAVFSLGNMNYFMVPERDESTLTFRGALYGYGKYDDENQSGLFRFLRVDAGTAGNEVRAIPGAIPVANLLYLPGYFPYTSSIAGSGKIYFTTVENNTDTSSSGRIGRLWRHRMVPTGVGSIVAGVYETQTQLFSKKVKVGEVRVYTEPLIGGNDFTVDLIGSGGSVMSGGSQRFQVATGSVATGTDMVQFGPVMAPTYALGVRITNNSVTGVANWTALKVEVDTTAAGK